MLIGSVSQVDWCYKLNRNVGRRAYRYCSWALLAYYLIDLVQIGGSDREKGEQVKNGNGKGK